MNIFQKAYYRADSFVQEHSKGFKERAFLPFLQFCGVLLMMGGFMTTVSHCRVMDSSLDETGKRIHEALYNETNNVPFEVANRVSREFLEVKRSVSLGSLMAFFPQFLTLSGLALFITAKNQKARKIPPPYIYPPDN